MKTKSILIVDDERNIRLTLAQSLEPLGMPVHTAVNGEDALKKLSEHCFGLMFLDLKMPGMDGMKVLQRVRERWPELRVIIITAYGTIDSAVEAMKLGAVDYIQKPFSPGEIRSLTIQVINRETLDENNVADYQPLVELAKRCFADSRFKKAKSILQKAISADPGRPEAYNLLGALLEIEGDYHDAKKFYRAAIDIDPTYKPALANLERSTSFYKFGAIELGPNQQKPNAEESGKNEKDETDET